MMVVIMCYTKTFASVRQRLDLVLGFEVAKLVVYYIKREQVLQGEPLINKTRSAQERGRNAELAKDPSARACGSAVAVRTDDKGSECICAYSAAIRYR